MSEEKLPTVDSYWACSWSLWSCIAAIAAALCSPSGSISKFMGVFCSSFSWALSAAICSSKASASCSRRAGSWTKVCMPSTASPSAPVCPAPSIISAPDLATYSPLIPAEEASVARNLANASPLTSAIPPARCCQFSKFGSVSTFSISCFHPVSPPRIGPIMPCDWSIRCWYICSGVSSPTGVGSKLSGKSLLFRWS